MKELRVLNLAQIAAINAAIIKHYDEQIAILGKYNRREEAVRNKQEYVNRFNEELRKLFTPPLRE